MRGNPHAAFDVAGAGNVGWSRWCDTRRRKGETTGNTNFDLHRRCSSRVGGTFRPSAFAVVKLMTKSNLVIVAAQLLFRAIGRAKRCRHALGILRQLFKCHVPPRLDCG